MRSWPAAPGSSSLATLHSYSNVRNPSLLEYPHPSLERESEPQRPASINYEQPSRRPSTHWSHSTLLPRARLAELVQKPAHLNRAGVQLQALLQGLFGGLRITLTMQRQGEVQPYDFEARPT